MLVIASQNSGIVFVLMLISYLLGWFLSNYFSARTSNTVSSTHSDTEKPRPLQGKEETINQQVRKKIKAIKTMERSGIAVEKNTPPQTTATELLTNLKLINGIGPAIEDKLKQSGIESIQQLASLTEEEVLDLTESLQFFPGRIKRDDWVGQAQQLLEKSNNSEK